MSKRTPYKLEPLLLSRTWQLAELRLELAAQNRQLAQQQQSVQERERDVETVREQWRAHASTAGEMRIDMLIAYQGYFGQLERKLTEARGEFERIQQLRDEVTVKVLQATRDLDAVERDKSRTLAQARAEGLKAEVKESDDHWLVLTNRRTHATQA